MTRDELYMRMDHAAGEHLRPQQGCPLCREDLERAFIDAVGLPSPGDPERRAEWERAL